MQRGLHVTGRRLPVLVASVICLSTLGLLGSLGQSQLHDAVPLPSAPSNPFSALGHSHEAALVAVANPLHGTYDVVQTNLVGFQRIQESTRTSEELGVVNASAFDIQTSEESEVTHPKKKVQVASHVVTPHVAPQPHHATPTHQSASTLSSRGESSIIQGTFGVEVAQFSQRFIGTPYVWGGQSPRGFDCSGFVKYSYQHFGVSLNRSSYEQFNQGSAVSRGNLMPGDLVFFDTDGGGASHVGIYLGGGQFINAAGSSVRIDSLSAGYWNGHYVGARHVH
jgi:cell wall-associated NlpC family hydrolase